MAKYYFTFGVGTPYKNIICEVEVPGEKGPKAYSDARDLFVSKFGLNWAFQYDEDTAKQFPSKPWWNENSKFVPFDELEAFK